MKPRRATMVGAVAALVALLGSSLVVSAATTWGITWSPDSVSALSPTTVRVEIWNLGGDAGDDDLGCVQIAIPPTFTVGAVTIVSVPAGRQWRASKSGALTVPRIVTIQARNGGSRLNANSADRVVADIVVTSLVPGLLDWDAHAHADQQCTDDFSEHISMSFTSGSAPTPTPVPTATPTPKPTAAPTPTPVPTATPKPTAAPTPTSHPTATPTPRPGATDVPTPTPVPTSADGSAEPSTDPGASPTPTATESGEPTPSIPGASPTPSASTGSGGSTSGGTTTPGGGDSSGAGGGLAGPGAAIAMPGVDGSGPGAGAIALSGLSALSFGGVEWLVPGLVLTVPGLLIVLVVLLQVVGALAWVPVARRRLGGADDTVRHLPSRGTARR